MRINIIRRLEEIRAQSGNFSISTFRWRNVKHDDKHISDVIFDDISDQDLLVLFERIIRNYYKQG